MGCVRWSPLVPGKQHNDVDGGEAGRPGRRRNGLRGLRESSEPGLPRLCLRPSARRVCVWPRLSPSSLDSLTRLSLHRSN